MGGGKGKKSVEVCEFSIQYSLLLRRYRRLLLSTVAAAVRRFFP